MLIFLKCLILLSQKEITGDDVSQQKKAISSFCFISVAQTEISLLPFLTGCLVDFVLL